MADSTLYGDKRRKVPRYARAGIPEVWLVDLERRLVTAYRDPTPGGYSSQRNFGLDSALTLLRFPDAAIPVASFIR